MDDGGFRYKNSTGPIRRSCKLCNNLCENIIFCDQCAHGSGYCTKCIVSHRDNSHKQIKCSIPGCCMTEVKKKLQACRKNGCSFSIPCICSSECRQKHELCHLHGTKCEYKVCNNVYGITTTNIFKLSSYNPNYTSNYFCSSLHKYFSYIYNKNRCKICSKENCGSHHYEKCYKCGKDKSFINYFTAFNEPEYVCLSPSCVNTLSREMLDNIFTCKCGNIAIKMPNLYCRVCVEYRCSYECLYYHYIKDLEDNKHDSLYCLDRNCKEISPICNLMVRCKLGCCSYCSIEHKTNRIASKIGNTACKLCGCINHTNAESNLCSRCDGIKCNNCGIDTNKNKCKYCSVSLCTSSCIIEHMEEHKEIMCSRIGCEEIADDTFKCKCGKKHCSFEHFATSYTHPQCAICLCIHKDTNWKDGISDTKCVLNHIICNLCSINIQPKQKCSICVGNEILANLCIEPLCTTQAMIKCNCGIKACQTHFNSMSPNNATICSVCGCHHNKHPYNCKNEKCKKPICKICWNADKSFCNNECVITARPKIPIVICENKTCGNEMKDLKECSCGKIMKVCSEKCYKTIMLTKCPTCMCIHNNPQLCKKLEHQLCERCNNDNKECKLCINIPSSSLSMNQLDAPKIPLPEIPSLSLKSENKQKSTEEDNMCKICFDKEIDVVILQCGHFAICSVCAPGVEKSGKGCPICRKDIEKTVKIFKS